MRWCNCHSNICSLKLHFYYLWKEWRPNWVWNMVHSHANEIHSERLPSISFALIKMIEYYVNTVTSCTSLLTLYCTWMIDRSIDALMLPDLSRFVTMYKVRFVNFHSLLSLCFAMLKCLEKILVSWLKLCWECIVT